MIPNITLDSDEQKFFRLKIGDELFTDEDLVIKVIPLDFISDPDIFISKVSFSSIYNFYSQSNTLIVPCQLIGSVHPMEKIHAQ